MRIGKKLIERLSEKAKNINMSRNEHVNHLIKIFLNYEKEHLFGTKIPTKDFVDALSDREIMNIEIEEKVFDKLCKRAEEKNITATLYAIIALCAEANP